MKVDQRGHTTIIKNTQGRTNEFLKKLEHEHHSFKEQNLIIDLLHDKELCMEDIKSFSEIIKNHTSGKKSMVLVAENINHNDVPKKITVVPTILEAHDIIELDEIERDLGF